MERSPGENEKSVIQELNLILVERTREQGVDTVDKKIGGFVAGLRGQFSEDFLYRTKLFHELFGSTAGALERFDVPGGLIERFIREDL